MFSVVSHWPGMRPNPKLFEIEEPPDPAPEAEVIVPEKPKPPSVYHHQRRRNSRMPSHADSMAVQKRALSLTKGKL